MLGEPEPRDHPRWPWTIAIETLLVVPVLDAAPPVEAIGVAARSMSQQSHISIRARALRARGRGDRVDRGLVAVGPEQVVRVLGLVEEEAGGVEHLAVAQPAAGA